MCLIYVAVRELGCFELLDYLWLYKDVATFFFHMNNITRWSSLSGSLIEMRATGTLLILRASLINLLTGCSLSRATIARDTC